FQFEGAIEIGQRRLKLSFEKTSAGARVIGAGETRIEGDGDAVIVNGAIILSPRLPFTAPREVRSRRLRARGLGPGRRQRGEQKSRRNDTNPCEPQQTMFAKHFCLPCPVVKLWRGTLRVWFCIWFTTTFSATGASPPPPSCRRDRPALPAGHIHRAPAFPATNASGGAPVVAFPSRRGRRRR